MDLHEIARTILFGSRWEDKLLFEENFSDSGPGTPLVEVPRFPGRPTALTRIGKAEFPGITRLAEDSSRGIVLHFFANHELLAMELMALMLLKFPGAPKAFRAGIARTIREEQEHLKLYVDRMRELGVEFGDLPVSDYFWNAMKDMASPLEFVVQMSLTLEQANLDYSLLYQRAVAQAGDVQTAAILERVYREEIGHVKHGLTWFNRWREETSAKKEDDWDAYVRLLPKPMTPRRAKGEEFTPEARRQAGFSERFISELSRYSGSKGRPPTLWFFNPGCEAEIVRGKAGHTPSEPVKRLTLDLEHLQIFLARPSDVILSRALPGSEWLESVSRAGAGVPEIRKIGSSDLPAHETRLAGIEPWGWSPDTFDRFRPLVDRLSATDGANGGWCRDLLSVRHFNETGLGAIHSKIWSARFLREWLAAHPEDEKIFGTSDLIGESFTDWESARARLSRALLSGETWLAKAPYGTSGTQNRRIFQEAELDSAIGGWIRGIIEAQGSILLEPYLDRLADLSLQMEIRPDSIRKLGIRQFVTGRRMEFRGTLLDAKLRTLPGELIRFLHSDPSPLSRWENLADALGARLRSLGYQGPAGIDGMIYRDPRSGEPRLRPLVELNPRWTMGRVALELEKLVQPGVEAHWSFIPVRELTARGLPAEPSAAAREWISKWPPRFSEPRGRLIEGSVFTSDPARAREVLTVLLAGEAAAKNPSLFGQEPVAPAARRRT